MDFLNAVILGIVEGVTEFLPISSTGHLIIVNEFFELPEKFENMFNIVIQLGAILSVIVYFLKRLVPWGKGAEERRDAWSLWCKVLVGVVPALIVGALLADTIEELFFNPASIAVALVIGGVLLIVIEGRRKSARYATVKDLTYRAAFFIGMIQCISMIPGTSRSAATIIGAMLLGASRGAAVEFSFFLAIPTMVAASGYSLLKAGASLTEHEWLVLGTGFAVSFFVAWAVIAFLMNYIRSHDFRLFGWYRIALACAIMVSLALGVIS